MKIAYFKEINQVLSAVTASSKNRCAYSPIVTSQVILHVSKDKDFSTRSNPETRVSYVRNKMLSWNKLDSVHVVFPPE